MAILDKLIGVSDEPVARTDGHPADSPRLDWVVALLSAVFAFGIYFDGWAHNNIPDLIETFFTPYHFLLYGGFFVTSMAVAVTHYRNTGKGFSWSKALPKGYMPALIGAIVFGIAGFGDLVWHETFGFEEDIEALLSPTHLMLAVGAILIMAAPLRARWQRADAVKELGWRDLFPAILSITLLLSIATFFIQYTHLADAYPITGRAPIGDEAFTYSVIGIYSIVMPLAFGIASILLLMQRWTLPRGTAAFVLIVNYALMFWMQEGNALDTPATLVAVLLGAGLVEGVYAFLKPNRSQPMAVRLFAFLTPFIISSLYVASLLLTSNLWWEIHMWAGIPFLAGVAGLFLSFLAVPMALPQEQATA